MASLVGNIKLQEPLKYGPFFLDEEKLSQEQINLLNKIDVVTEEWQKIAAEIQDICVICFEGFSLKNRRVAIHLITDADADTQAQKFLINHGLHEPCYRLLLRSRDMNSKCPTCSTSDLDRSVVIEDVDDLHPFGNLIGVEGAIERARDVFIRREGRVLPPLDLPREPLPAPRLALQALIQPRHQLEYAARAWLFTGLFQATGLGALWAIGEDGEAALLLRQLILRVMGAEAVVHLMNERGSLLRCILGIVEGYADRQMGNRGFLQRRVFLEIEETREIFPYIPWRVIAAASRDLWNPVNAAMMVQIAILSLYVCTSLAEPFIGETSPDSLQIVVMLCATYIISQLFTAWKGPQGDQAAAQFMQRAAWSMCCVALNAPAILEALQLNSCAASPYN